MTTKEVWRRLGWYLTYLGPRRDITVETLNGVLSFSSKDWLIGKYLYVRRSHETHEIRNVVKLLKILGYCGNLSRGGGYRAERGRKHRNDMRRIGEIGGI